MKRPFLKRTMYWSRLAFRVGRWLGGAALALLPPSLEVFLHACVGDRYLARVAGSLLLFLLYRCCVLHTQRVSSSRTERFFLALYGVAFLAFALFHFARIVVSAGGRGDVHSRSTGWPWPFWNRLRLPSFVIVRFVEPLLCYSFGVAVSYVATALAAWIKLASIALFLKTQLEWWAFRTRTLDAMDARIEGRALTSAMEGRMGRNRPAPGRFFEAKPARRQAPAD